MAVYEKVANRELHATAHCPKCLSIDLIISKTHDEIYCRSCGWTGKHEEMAFMKVRSRLPVPMGRGVNFRTNMKTKHGGRCDG